MFEIFSEVVDKIMNKDNERDNWMYKEQMKIRLFVQLVEENEMQLPMNSRITATLDLF